MCGGSIISSLHILTAAHCVEPLIKNDRLRQSITIVSGTTLLNSGGQAHGISRMWCHESYNPNTPGRDAGFDIGLIKVRILDKSCYIRFIYTVTFPMHMFFNFTTLHNKII